MNRIKLRENTFKLLYCNEFYAQDEMPKQFELYWEEPVKVSEESIDEIIEEVKDKDKQYISDRVTAIMDMKDAIDEKINEVAVGWTTDRMSKVDLTILRLAYYEMKIDEEIPEKVAVDQAVELAKKYGSDESPAFINGILAKLF